MKPDLSATPAPVATTATSVVKKMNLFDYTEEELYCSNSNTNSSKNTNSNSNNSNNSNSNNNNQTLKFNHYELLQIPIHATSYEIKKAYRKLSLQYHPDKTGRDENDYGTFGYIYLCVSLCFVEVVLISNVRSLCIASTHSYVYFLFLLSSHTKINTHQNIYKHSLFSY